jgi:hypothetical protein
MRRVGLYLLVILMLWSCEEEILEISFAIQIEGFTLKEAYVDSLDVFPSFSHRVSGGNLAFSMNNNSYEFNTGSYGIEEYTYKLPPGVYQLEFAIPVASLYGQDGGSFVAHPQEVIITEQTEIISVQGQANCSMFLVYDELNQLDKGVYMIERHSFAHGFFWSYPLFTDSISEAFYTYFIPDTVPSDPSAFLWFFDGEPGIEEGGLSTKDLEIGYQYNVKVLDK